jgi:hypothetical protein
LTDLKAILGVLFDGAIDRRNKPTPEGSKILCRGKNHPVNSQAFIIIPNSIDFISVFAISGNIKVKHKIYYRK